MLASAHRRPGDRRGIQRPRHREPVRLNTACRGSREGETDGSFDAADSPGEILAGEFLEPLGVSQYRLAMAIGVPPRRINEIVHGKRRISADTALRLARYFGTSDRFWMNLQNRFDLEIERDRLGSDLRRIKPFAAA
ncbi:HigA family addiction module antitoxin [Glycomyces algeriensis]|nr:HigA family addiction module antitoxin [Glycomyces algeriensis]MDA1368915.1 HigA family addiction module antitoxin [Glycomyces algeriensis]